MVIRAEPSVLIPASLTASGFERDACTVRDIENPLNRIECFAQMLRGLVLRNCFGRLILCDVQVAVVPVYCHRVFRNIPVVNAIAGNALPFDPWL